MANPVFMRLMVLLAKIETAYATDPVLTGAENAILAKNVTLRPMEGDDVARDLIRDFLSNQGTIPTGLRVVIEFETELAGSGEAGTPPAWGVLMRGCACAEVIEEDTSVTYTPVTDNHESLYFKYWLGPTLHGFAGARGTGVITENAQGIPVIRWTFTGLWVAPADVARAAAVFSAWKEPLVVSKTNTPTFTVNAVPLVMRNFSLNLGNDVQPRLLVNRENIMVVDRAEALDVTVEVTPLAIFDPFALAQARTQVPVMIVHGLVAGNIITLTAPKCQVKRPQAVTENQGVAERVLNLAPLPDTGDDQFSLVLT
ncbi:MAG: phage tail tube protein [Afipia sp.]